MSEIYLNNINTIFSPSGSVFLQMQMRNVIDPKRHYKKGDTKASIKYFQASASV